MLLAEIITSFPLQLVSDAWGRKLQNYSTFAGWRKRQRFASQETVVHLCCVLVVLCFTWWILSFSSLCLLFRFRHQIKSTVLTIWSTRLTAHKRERSFTNVHMSQGTKPKENLVSICETTKQQYCVTPWERKQTENNSNAKSFLCKAAVGKQAS